MKFSMNNMHSLWNDDAGTVYLEYLILATILGLGVIVGVASLRSALTAEYVELSSSILALDQGISVDGLSTCVAAVDPILTVDTDGTVSQTGIVSVEPTTATVISALVCP